MEKNKFESFNTTQRTKTQSVNIIDDDYQKLHKRKTASLVLIKDNERSKHIENSDLITEAILNTILNGDDALIDEAITQLENITSFEMLLYKELRKFILITKPANLKKIYEIIEATFNLNQIAREARFCQSQGINDPSTIEKLLDGVEDNIWKLIFVLYNPEAHFEIYKPEEPQSTLKKRIIEIL